MLVKSSTIAMVVPEFLFVLLLNLIEEVGTVLMLLHRSISIENRLPPVDRIVPLQASLSCDESAEFEPNSQALGLDDIVVAHCSYRCVPVGRLAAY